MRELFHLRVRMTRQLEALVRGDFVGAGTDPALDIVPKAVPSLHGASVDSGWTGTK